MSSSPRLLLSKCSCTCGARSSPILSSVQAGPSRKSMSTTASRAASTSSTSTHRIQPRQRWLMPNFQARKRGVDLPPPKAQKFENKLNLPDGTVSSIYTTSPRPKIAITKDTTNHPLWAFTSAGRDVGGVQQEDEGGRMGRFARKFGASQSNNASSEADKKPDQGSASKTTTEAQGSTDKTSSKDKTANKKEASSAPATTKPVESAKQEQASDDMDFFDLALEGEEAEVTGHKVVEETGGKKGKKGTGKKK